MREQEDQGSAAENLAQGLLRLSAEDMSNVITWLHSYTEAGNTFERKRDVEE